MATAVPSAPTRPRFRTDLVAEPIEEEGQRYVDVIDPDTGSAFRFYEVEYSIACAMDGERDISGLVAWAREELGVAPTSEELSTVIATLGDLGYIEAGLEPAPAESPFDLAAPGSLAKGVTAPRPAPPPLSAADDVELGFSEGTARALGAPLPASVAAADVELGHVTPQRPAPAKIPAGPQTELGPAGSRTTSTFDDNFSGVTDAQGNVVEFDAITPPPPSEEFVTTRPVLRPLSRADADDDGPTNLPRPQVGDFDDDEVSVDLTDHVPLRPDDVKEAVRQSKVMKAVEVPPELMGQLDDREKQIAAAAEAAKQAARQRVADDQPTKPIERMQKAEPVPVPESGPVARPAEAKAPVEKPAERPSGKIEKSEKLAVELPRDAVAVSRPKAPSLPAASRQSEPKIATPVTPEQRQPSRLGPILLILLILAILAIAGFFVWRLVFDKPSTTPAIGTEPPVAEPVATTPPPAPVEPAPPPPPPPAPSATMALSTGPGAEVASSSTGVVAFAVAAGTEVKPDDILIKLGGYQRFEAKLGDGKTGGLLWDIDKRVPREIEKYKADAEKARAGGAEGLAKALEKKAEERSVRLEQKKKERDLIQEALAKFFVKSATGGTVKMVAAPGKRVKEGDVVVRLEGAKALSATFTVEGKAFTAESPVKVAAKAAPEKTIDCTVAEVKGSSVTVRCPPDAAAAAGIADGTEVILP